MILDSSAIVSILFKEPDWHELVRLMADAETLAVGAATLAETVIVVGTRLAFDRPHVPRFVQTFGVAVIPFGNDHWDVAGLAYRRYGRGRHPAGLNFGDCLTYATAKLAQRPLLCKGNNFKQTDLELVLP